MIVERSERSKKALKREKMGRRMRKGWTIFPGKRGQPVAYQRNITGNFRANIRYTWCTRKHTDWHFAKYFLFNDEYTWLLTLRLLIVPHGKYSFLYAEQGKWLLFSKRNLSSSPFFSSQSNSRNLHDVSFDASSYLNIMSKTHANNVQRLMEQENHNRPSGSRKNENECISTCTFH